MTHKPSDKASKHSITKQTRNLTLILSIGMLAGVLIWAKLRLVTDIPRSAYADPRDVEPPKDIADTDADQSPEQDQDPDESSETDPGPVDKPAAQSDPHSISTP